MCGDFFNFYKIKIYSRALEMQNKFIKKIESIGSKRWIQVLHKVLGSLNNNEKSLINNPTGRVDNEFCNNDGSNLFKHLFNYDELFCLNGMIK